MTGPLASFSIAGTGLRASSTWLNAIAHNVANVQTTTAGDDEPFRAVHTVLAEQPGRGVAVVGVAEQDGEPARVFDPAHPLADANGHVAQPVVDLGSELVDMIMANRAYQANLQTVHAARERYEAAMRLGR